jgi:orotate phosphoribosyltransferase
MTDSRKSQFIQLLMDRDVLRFGDFTLKSGRISPYFFNMGAVNEGKSLSELGAAYADAIVDLDIPVDCLFGPAYKGIPLVAAASMAFHYNHNRSVPYCFNRKQAKTYGDGGDLVGAPLQGQVIMVDDVITAGTTVKETSNLFAKYGAALSGIVIALDREEKNAVGEHALSALSRDYHVPITPIITLSDVIDFLRDIPEHRENLEQIANYQAEYGAKAC